MTTQQAALAAHIKAVAALVVSAVVTYVATALVDGQVWTVHGVEVAAATAVLTALGVHAAPQNKAKGTASRPKHDGGAVTMTVHADTAPALAALKEVQAEAARTAKAVAKVTPKQRRRA